jgi:hypothetical protein
MKKHLLTFALSCLTAASLRADLVWYEGFNYPNGSLTNNSAGVWAIHSTSGADDFFVKNHRAEISGNTSTNAPRQADVHRDFCTSACPYTNGVQAVYASFTINCTNLPTAFSNYVTHFLAGNNQNARVFSIIGTMPGTWRLGISGVSASVSKIFPVDLARNIDYQVVVKWNPVANSDPDSKAGTLWINPISSSDPSVISGDGVTTIVPATGYAFRQAAGATSFFANVTNLAVATTFDEAATNIWSTNAVAPIVAIQPKTGTNFVGDAVNLFGVIAGQGQGSLAYQWVKDGVNISNPNGNSNVFSIASAAVSDTGSYTLIGTTPYGLSATTAVAFLWVTNPPVPPTITQQPTSTNVFSHQTVALKVVATGPPTLGYQWFLNNSPVVDGPNFLGANSDTLVVSDITATDGTTGTYRVDVSNPYGTTPSANVTLTVTNPPTVSIAYLRTLIDPVSLAATNNTQLWQVTGAITTFTNLTSGNTASYYLQDGTAGINLFATSGQTFRPQQGDIVTLVGFLQTFQGNLELEADTVGNPATSYTILSNNLALLPAPKVIPYNSVTNNILLTKQTLEGSVVMLTNAFFTNSTISIGTAGATILVTNASGQNMSLLFSPQDLDTANQTLPPFAYTISGILTQNTNSPPGSLNRGFQVTVSKFSDIVTDPPPAMTLTQSHSGTITSLSWDAVPYAYSYSVLAASDVAGPYLPTAGYQARMLAATEVPGNRSTGIGFGTVELSPDESSITVNMSFSGLTAPATAAHIHGPAGAGTNASVLFPFSGVPSATSGAIPQQTFAINPTQVGYLKNGLLYMNVHNGNFPGGELRAQLLPVPSVGLTFTNASGFYNDRNATNSATFYRVVSP